MKWVEDGSRPRFDLFGFRMKVVCKVHILSRFHFFSFLNQTVHLFTHISIFFQLFRCFSLTSSHLYLFWFYFFFIFFQMNEMSRRWVTTKIWFIWFQNESGMWSSSYFYSAFGYFHLMFPSNSIILQTDFSTFVWLFIFVIDESFLSYEWHTSY